MSRGKIHGSIDVGLSVISIKNSSRRIHIDSDVCIFSLKVKKDDFTTWVSALRNHRLSRQHEIYYGNQSLLNPCDKTYSLQTEKPNNDNMSSNLMLSKYNENEIKDKLIKLSSLLKFIELQSSSLNSSVTDLEGFKYKKHRKRFHFRRKKSPHVPLSKNIDSNSDHLTLKDDLVSLKNQNFLSISHPSLTEEDCLNQMLIKAKQYSYDNESNKSLSKYKAMTEFIQIANESNRLLF